MAVGRLVPAEIFIVDYGASEATGSAPWPLCYQVGIVSDSKRNEAVVRLAELSPKPCLILIKDIEHGDELYTMLGGHAAFIHGNTPNGSREAVLDAMRNGHQPIVLSSVILDEGVDVPAIRSLVLAGGTKARHRIKQRIGRGMRAVEGKHKLMVWDFADAGKYLGAHARDRQILYSREEMFTPYHLTMADAIGAFSGRNHEGD